MVEHRTVNAMIVGSTPTVHPTDLLEKLEFFGCSRTWEFTQR